MSAFREGINSFIDDILLKSDGNVLIISHVFVMKHLQKVLIKRGFSGSEMKTPDYGKLYVLER